MQARVIVTSPAIASQKPGSEFAVSERDSHVLHTNVQIQRPPNARTTPKVFTLNMGQVVPYVPNVLSFTDTSSSLNTQLYKTNDENQEPCTHVCLLTKNLNYAVSQTYNKTIFYYKVFMLFV